MPSQNVTFDGDAPPIEDEELTEPEGASILTTMRPILAGLGWQVSDLEIGHGAWTIVARKDNAELEIAIAGPLVEDGSAWFLQISYEAPSFLARAFGRRATASPGACFALAQNIHDFLTRHGFTNLRWSDGPPTDESATEPLAPS
jgi:hypothetical protein